jgi:hypothetical protein
VIDEVGEFEVHLVAGRDQLGQADAARRGARQQRAQDAAALRDDADGAGREVVHLQGAGRREHDVVGEVHQADRVRAEDAHRARGFDQMLLAPCAFRAGFGVAAGQHDGRRGAARREVAHGQVRTFGTEQHDADIRHRRQRCDVGVAGQFADAVDLRVHRIDVAGKAMLDQVGHRPAGRLRGIGRGADDGDAAGPEESGDRVHVHSFAADLARKAMTDSRCSVLV